MTKNANKKGNAKSVSSSKGANAASTKGSAALAPCTLGTYLIHIIVLKTLMAAGLSGLMFGPLVGVPLLTVIVTALSYLIAWMLKQIPFVGRYLV